MTGTLQILALRCGGAHKVHARCMQDTPYMPIEWSFT